jgi:hypothetical protein
MNIDRLEFEEDKVYGVIYDHSKNPSKTSVIEVSVDDAIFHENADVTSSWRDNYYIEQDDNYSSRKATREELETVLRQIIIETAFKVSKSLK